MSAAPKYIFVNGVMKLNPNYGQTSTVANPNQALAIVASTDDIMAAQETTQRATGYDMQLSEATTSSMQIMQDQDWLAKFKAKNIDAGDILDGLTLQFAQYEVPIGLINKLLALSMYQLNFIIDDSGSMNTRSDAPFCKASQHTKTARDPRGQRKGQDEMLTRWEEAEDRLHVFMDLLAYIPSDYPNSITLSFLNRTDKQILNNQGLGPQEFARIAHQKITSLFDKAPSGYTPLCEKVKQAFNTARGPTMHYILTDGVPSDATIPTMKALIKNRQQPGNNPVTFLSCTNEDSEAEWMKEIEEDAEYCAELDDFDDERNEVANDHGPVFPYSRGFWLLCSLVAAINPDDLDALDESTPFTKCTMDNLMGRKLSLQEYFHYFDSNPNAKRYQNKRQQFAREDILAKQLK